MEHGLGFGSSSIGAAIATAAAAAVAAAAAAVVVGYAWWWRAKHSLLDVVHGAVALAVWTIAMSEV